MDRPAIAEQLASGASATALFAQLAGAALRFAVWHTADIMLDTGQCALLHAGPGTAAQWRHGTFTAAGEVIAEVSSVVIMGRLPAAAVARLAAGTPLGAVLAGFGRREPLSVVPFAGGVASSARIWATGEPVALATEQIRPWACRSGAF